MPNGRRFRLTWRFAVAAMAVLVAACGSSGSSKEAGEPDTTTARCDPEASTALDVPYASHPGTDPRLTSVDVYAPPRHGCEPLPVVVWVHGGAWITGDKSSRVDDKIALFGDAGYVFVSVNYRLTDPEAEDPLRYPAHNEDVAQALAWLVESVDDYGGDPEKVAVLGHSAGAGIVAAIATDPRYLGAHDLGLDAIDCVAPWTPKPSTSRA
ncbi:MAG: alpha/beta hydrolase [Acidimicrobiia bacterium]|nr:alpha/beta hydrolase [Acidimicrobiia bacterium]